MPAWYRLKTYLRALKAAKRRVQLQARNACVRAASTMKHIIGPVFYPLIDDECLSMFQQPRDLSLSVH